MIKILPTFKKKTEKKPAAPSKRAEKKPAGANHVILWMDEKWVKMVFSRGKPGRAHVESLCAVSVENKDDDVILREVRDAAVRYGTEKASAYIVHPAHLSRSRFLRLPATDSKELAVMVDLQVEKNTPDSKEDTLTYYRVLKSDSEGYSQVFLVMTHQDRVSRAVRLAQKIFPGLENVSTDMDGLALWMSKQSQGEGGTLLIDLDHEYAAVMVLHGGNVCFHRSIGANRDNVLADPAGTEAQRFLSELHRSLMAYDEEGLNGPCARVQVIGEPAQLNPLLEQMRKELHLPVTAVPSQSGISLSPKALEQLGLNPGISFAGLFGFLIPGYTGDLTPPSVKVRRLFHQKVKAASVLAGQILGGLLLIFAFLFYGVHQDMRYAVYLEARNSQIEAPARELEISIEHLKIVRGRIDKRGILLDAMTAIAAVTSPAIRWTGVTYNQNEGIVVKGVSDAMANVFEMVSELEKNTMFAKPEARRVTKRKVDGADVTDFEIVLPLADREGIDEAS